VTILMELATLYDRLAAAGRAPRPGYSRERIGYEVLLEIDGRPAGLSPLVGNDPKRPGRDLSVPAAVKRSSGIQPNRLWDKTAYALGVTAVERDGTTAAGQAGRTAAEHAAFVAGTRALLEGAEDQGLGALLGFCDRWRPEMFTELGWPVAALDANVVFRWIDDPDGTFLHDRPAALALFAGEGRGDGPLCLVTGERARPARLHPVIKGVDGAQSSGASLVSFNSDAYESFGARQGNNAPVSERAAFAYGTALNALLDRAGGHRLRIGDATVVFWAEGTRDAAVEAEAFFFAAVEPGETTAHAEARLRADLQALAQGRGIEGAAFSPDTRVFVLGLAPNAARLAVRFWQPGRFGDLARHVLRFWEDLALEPRPWKGPPAARALLYETAPQREAKNIPPLLGGAVMRSLLTGAPLPRTLLSTVVARIRADGEITGRRAAICKAAVDRSSGKKVIPVSLDHDNTDPAYLLGRLFGAYAYAEQSHAKRSATIRDKYLAGASANPARVFPLLMRGYENNRSALMKAAGPSRGAGVRADKAVTAILDRLDGGMALPASLALEDQGRFFVGFYHQWNDFYAKPEEAAEAAVPLTEDEDPA
jgi:CRISPR-associated protein Csd1